MPLDLLLTNATIIDGTGDNRTPGGVIGITDGVISLVDTEQPRATEARTTIDVAGNTVAPGFIDILSYADLEVFSAPARSMKLHQGVTTELVGTNGYSMAPLWYKAEETHSWRLGEADWRTFLSGQFGRAEEAWDWGSVSDYLAAVDQTMPGTHIGTLVGHGTLRHNVTGLRELPPTEEEVTEMGDLLELGLMDGGLGLSTTTALLDNTVSTEVRSLVERLAEYDCPVVVRCTSGPEGAIDSLHNAAAEYDVPVHLSDLSGASLTGLTPGDHLAAARQHGLDPTGDISPYDDAVVTLTELLPREVYEGGEAGFTDFLDNADQADELRDEIATATEWNEARLLPPHPAAGCSVADVAESSNTPLAEVVVSLLNREAETHLLIPAGNPSELANVRSSPAVTVSTGGTAETARTRRKYGSFVASLEAASQRDDIDLTEQIRKLTSLPADLFGLRNKGRIEEDMDGDLVILDSDSLAEGSTWDAPERLPSGIEHVLVGGRFAIKHGETTGERSGQPLRQSRTVN